MKITDIEEINPMAWTYGPEFIDCRSCQNYNNMRGRCHATALCTNADGYTSKPLIQLWDGKK